MLSRLDGFDLCRTFYQEVEISKFCLGHFQDDLANIPEVKFEFYWGVRLLPEDS